MSTTEDTFNLAVHCHQAGDLPRAEELYREILSVDPQHSRALHFLGVIAFQAGKFDQAIQHMEAALKLDANSPEFYNNLGVVYQQQGDIDRAAAFYQQALQFAPQHAEAHKGLGDIYCLRKQFSQAVTSYQAAVAAKPAFHDAQVNLGAAYHATGRLADAEARFRAALRLQPSRAETAINLGDVLQQSGKPSEALEAFRHAARAAPRLALAYLKLGLLLQQLGCSNEAIDWYHTALANHLDDASIHVSLGDACQLLGQIDKAKAAYIAARQIDPNLRFAWAGLGMIHQIEGDFSNALACYKRAVELDPEFGQAHFNLAALLLMQGEFAQGWSEYAWRWKIPNALEQREAVGPLWDGTPMPQGTLLIFGEQGLGDTLQFIRYVQLVRERVGRVIVECPASLVPLLKRLPGIDELVARGDRLPRCDAQVPLLSLPGIFQATLESIPGGVPYLFADPARVDCWKDELTSVPGFRVGIVWRGNPRHRLDALRSFEVQRLAPLAKVPGVRLFSLQKGAGSEQLADFAAEYPVLALGERLSDLEDTAAVMQYLDLVVSCDSAPAHLAGALGVPVWVALQFSPDWRWLLERKDSPWYPTMRLFRQPRMEAWEPVFDRMAAELTDLVHEKQ